MTSKPKKPGRITEKDLSLKSVPNGRPHVVMEMDEISEEKRGKEVLDESEFRFRYFVENANDIIFALTPEGLFSYVSPNWSDFMGEPAQQAIGKSFEPYVHPADIHLYHAFYQKVLKTGRKQSSEEYRVKHADGAWRWHVSNGSPMRDKDGNVCGYFGIARDVTEKKQAEEALLHSEEKFRLTFAASPDSVNINRLEDGLYVDINKSFERLTGFTREDVTGKTSLEISIWSDPEDRQTIVRGLREKGLYENFEAQFRRKDGSLLTGLMSAAVIHINNEPHSINITRDISEFKRVQNALRESEERFHKAFMSNPAPLVISDIKTGEFIDVNERWIKMLGFSKEEQIGRTSKQVGIWDEPDERDRMVKLIEENGFFKDERIIFRKNSGEKIHALWSAELILLAGRKVMLSMIFDETARIKSEQENLKLQSQLMQSQKMESVGRLAGGVAHDYNNMLSVISGYTEMALEKLRPNDPLYSDLTEVYKAAARSTEITRQLLAFARKQSIDPKVIDLNAVLESMLRMLRRLIGENIDLVWLPGKHLWTVKIDPSQIDQVLANLCVNARDAITGVGKVVIETGNITIDNAYCEMHTGFMPGDFLMLAVSDNGRGMDEEIKENIFEPFFTTKGLTEGTGLGLATVYGIVKQNTGFVNVYSEPGKGTTFKIYLPRHVGDAPRLRAVNKTKTPKGNGETLLLVEDEPSIMHMAEIMLKRLGYQVLAAATPAQALAFAEQHAGRIDLLITDVVMPEMSGRHLARKIHSLFPKIKTLFMSGYTANVIVHNGILDEGVNFIQKPFSQHDLGIKIASLLKAEL